MFGHATGLAADLSRAGDDPDNDGQTNLQEYLAGTDPFTPPSVLKITGMVKTDSYVEVTWFGADGVNYQLQRTDNLTQPNWTNAYPSVRGSGGFSVARDYSPAYGASWQFYRVIVSP